MNIKEVIIDGNNFNNLAEFYNEVESKLTKGLNWKIGRNLDAFNDVLRGGFGVHKYEEGIKLKWINSEKSKEYLGKAETVKYLKKMLKTCHPSNINDVAKELKEVEDDKGQLLFDKIIEIAQNHEQIELIIE